MINSAFISNTMKLTTKRKLIYVIRNDIGQRHENRTLLIKVGWKIVFIAFCFLDTTFCACRCSRISYIRVRNKRKCCKRGKIYYSLEFIWLLGFQHCWPAVLEELQSCLTWHAWMKRQSSAVTEIFNWELRRKYSYLA